MNFRKFSYFLLTSYFTFICCIFLNAQDGIVLEQRVFIGDGTATDNDAKLDVVGSEGFQSCRWNLFKFNSKVF